MPSRHRLVIGKPVGELDRPLLDAGHDPGPYRIMLGDR